MKLARLTFLFLLASILLSCGSSPASKTIDGAWRANLLNPDSSTAYTFTTVLTQGTSTTLDVTGFLFVTQPSCFPTPLGQNATFSVTGHRGGFQTGPFTMTISTAFGTMVENVLTLNGNRNGDGSITGTWTLTGLGVCSGPKGNYSMQLLPAM